MFGADLSRLAKPVISFRLNRIPSGRFGSSTEMDASASVSSRPISSPTPIFSRPQPQRKTFGLSDPANARALLYSSSASSPSSDGATLRDRAPVDRPSRIGITPSTSQWYYLRSKVLHSTAAKVRCLNKWFQFVDDLRFYESGQRVAFLFDSLCVQV